MNEQARLWQQRLDRDFPHGIIAWWEDGDEVHVYHVPRAEVTSMRGLDPYVYLDVPQWDKNVSGVLASYRVLRTEPWLLARVTFRDHSHPMLWRAVAGGKVAGSLSQARRESLERTERGEVFQGEAPEREAS